MGMTIAQGIFAEGKVEGMRETILLLGRQKFGKPDAATLQVLQSTTDLDQLDRMIDKILTATSWAELLDASSGNGN